MTTYSAETNGYNEACKLIEKLQAEGIQASITSGGVAIHCKPEQVNLVKKICQNCQSIFKPGYSNVEQNFLSKHPDGLLLLKKSQDDAQSVLNEWKE